MATQGKDTSPLSLSSAISVNGAGYEIGELTYGQLACRHCTGCAETGSARNMPSATAS